MWLRDYHLDGLRLDAVHAMEDHRAVHLLEELAARVGALSADLHRDLVLIAESDANDPRLVTPRPAGGFGLTAQWSDDFHHAVHAAVTGERQGYYCDFGTMAALAKTLTRVFFHDGTWSQFRGRSHGRPVPDSIGADRFVSFLQNHDQVGNRAMGDRTAATTSLDMLKVAAGLVLTAPFTPMLFMGEEWGARTPWQYFTDHPDPVLGRAVADGPAGRVRRARVAAGPDPRPAGSGDVRPVQARLVRGGRAVAAGTARLVPPAHRAAAQPSRTERPRPRGRARWLRRGRPLADHAPRRAAGNRQPQRAHAAGGDRRRAGARAGREQERRVGGWRALLDAAGVADRVAHLRAGTTTGDCIPEMPDRPAPMAIAAVFELPPWGSGQGTELQEDLCPAE